MNLTHRPLCFAADGLIWEKCLRRMKVFNSFENVSNTTDYCTEHAIVYHGAFEKLQNE